MSDPDYVLEMRGISKSFFGVKALEKVDLRVKSGEIHAVVGENGAGKSTLMNILSGTYPFGTYSGDIVFNGRECRFADIKESEAKGLVIIHQELALVPNMSIAENIFLGNERGSAAAIDWNRTYSEAEKHLRMVEIHDDPSTLVKDIGIGKQQLVEIAKALAKDVKLLILDEPTAALNEKDSMRLLRLLLDLKSKGVTSIIISHKLNEVCFVADSITVIRDGATIETMDNRQKNVEESRIIKGMVGREMTERYPKRNGKIGQTALEVKNWSLYHAVYTERKVVDNVSLNVKKGEVVGLYGLMGAGRTEFAMSLFGKSYGTGISGTAYKNGVELHIKDVVDAIKSGIAYIPEDRKENGLNLIGSLQMNISLAGLKQISSRGIVDNDQDIRVAEDHVQKLSIKTSGIEQKVESLSGGNQQKVVLAKWIFTTPEILILDEPTRGVDVGAKFEIYAIINNLVEQGAAVLFISSDLSEILGMCDRIYVMNEGRIVNETPAAVATQESIMRSIVGQAN